jgi:type VI secretion system Hcp family effector
MPPEDFDREYFMAVNAFISFFDKADGESTQKGKKNWVEIQAWDWEIEAESSWTKGGGASVGKPNPGKMSWEHYFDTSSIVIMGYICTGKAFPKVELEVAKSGAKPEIYFTMEMEGVFITKVSNSGTEEGNITQRVEMVFKTVKIDYKPQDKNGKLGTARTFTWDIPAGTASPSA